MSAQDDLTKVITDDLASQLLFGNTNDKAGILARHLVKTLLQPEGVDGGWLIARGAVHRIQEVGGTDTIDGSRTWELFTEDEED